MERTRGGERALRADGTPLWNAAARRFEAPATPAKRRERGELDLPGKLITAFGGNHVGRMYAQTTINETTPGHVLTRWAPPNTSHWSVNEVGRLKRLPPPVLIEQDGFLVSRGFNGGLRPSSSALRCDRFFDHACYGKVGQHVYIITNDTKYRNNSTWKVYDWFGPTKLPRAGFATRTVDVLRVSNKEMEQYASSSGFLDGSVLTFVNWPEQSHLGHFMMVAGTQFEYADVLQKCQSKHALHKQICNGSVFWSLQPNAAHWSTAAWVRGVLPAVLRAGYGPLCHSNTRGFRHITNMPHFNGATGAPSGVCTRRLYVSATDTDEATLAGSAMFTRLPSERDGKDLRRELYQSFGVQPSAKEPCNLLFAQHKRRKLEVEAGSVEQLAVSLGFRVRSADLGALPLAEQMRAVANASVIVTREGSHMANLIAAQRRTVLVVVNSCGADDDIMWLGETLGLYTAPYHNRDGRLVRQERLSERCVAGGVGIVCANASNLGGKKRKQTFHFNEECGKGLARWRTDPRNCSLMPSVFCDVIIQLDPPRFAAILRRAARTVGCPTNE